MVINLITLESTFQKGFDEILLGCPPLVRSPRIERLIKKLVEEHTKIRLGVSPQRFKICEGIVKSTRPMFDNIKDKPKTRNYTL